jgi:hypothetical protein
MTARIWPDTLPGIIEPGFSLSPAEQSVRTDMEVGPRRLRRISKARADSVTLAWKMTDTEMEAFRVWYSDEARSLAGASDDVTGWSTWACSVTADAGVGPALQLADTIVENGATDLHRIAHALPAVLDGDEVAIRATLRAAGRSAARVALIDRTGFVRSIAIDLTTGVLSDPTGISASAVRDRGDGWWRVMMTAPAGTGVAVPEMRIVLLNGAGEVTYAGDGVSGVAVCEVNARVATGYDLFLPTDATGHALGAAGGSAWFLTQMAFGGGFQTVEARFEAPFEAKVLPGLGWHVTSRLEVRYA